MLNYTELLENKAETLFIEDEKYEESLIEIAGLFHGFDEAMTAFIRKQGYIDDADDIELKVRFVQEKFKASGMKVPRGIKGWFTGDTKPNRDTAFQICFAFKLSIDKANEFFRCVQLERSFDCHTISEAVYYFGIKNQLGYQEAKEIVERIKKPKKAKAVPDQQVLYTGSIRDYIDSISDNERLISYIEENIDDFAYNNVTAVKYIQELWGNISKTDGLAVKEGQLITRSRNIYDHRENYVISKNGASTWTIFSQIIGLSNDMENEYAAKYDRSLAKILSGNKLFPLNADYCFPSRQNIDRLLRGETGDNEQLRKMLIFLVFYSYWVQLGIRKEDAFCTAQYGDSRRCLNTINKRLLDADYPSLYAGNPYDWLFLWALNDDHPLEAFRSYIGEAIAVKEEQNIFFDDAVKKPE